MIKLKTKNKDNYVPQINEEQINCKTCGDGIFSPDDGKQYKKTNECMLHSKNFLL